MLIGVRDGKAVAVQGDPDHPVNRGRLCPKGLTEHHTIGAPGRLTTPVVDGAGGVVGRRPRRTWPARSAASSTSTAPRAWPSSPPASSSPRSSTRSASWPASASGSPTTTATPPCAWLGRLRLQAGLRQRRPARVLRRLRRGRPRGAVRRQRGRQPPAHRAPADGPGPAAALIVVDPRVTKTAMIADQHLPLKPRTDITLINGHAPPAVRRGPRGPGVPRRAHRGASPSSRPTWPPTTPSASPPSAASPSRPCVDVARAIGAAERCMIAWTMGINHSVQGTETVAAAVHAGRGHRQHRPAGRVAVLHHRAVQRDGHPRGGLHRVDARLPGLRRPRRPRRAGRAVGRRRDELPDRAGPGLPRHHQRGHERAIKALWIIGTNPLVSFPNREVLEHALAAARPAGGAGRVRDAHHRARRRRAPRRHLGREGGHLHELRAPGARGSGPRWRRPARPGPTSTSSSAWPSTSASATHSTRAGRRRRTRSTSGAGCRPAGCATTAASPTTGSTPPAASSGPAPPTTPTCRWADHPASTPTAASPTPPGKVRLHCVDRQELRDQPRPEFPLLLNTGRTVEHWHTRTKTARVPLLERLAPGGVGGDQRGRRRPARRPHRRPRAGRPRRGARRPHRRPGHPDRPRRRGVHPVPLRRGLRQPPHASTSSTRSPASPTTSSAPSRLGAARHAA